MGQELETLWAGRLENLSVIVWKNFLENKPTGLVGMPNRKTCLYACLYYVNQTVEDWEKPETTNNPKLTLFSVIPCFRHYLSMVWDRPGGR